METSGDAVSVVRLPDERERLADLRRRGVPRLVLVAASELAAAAAGTDAMVLVLEDWAPPEASAAEIALRRRALAVRYRCVPRPVTVSDDGILTTPRGRVIVAPVEARILGVLLGRSGRVVSRAELARAGWPGRHVPRNRLDVHVSRLRRRLAEVGIGIITVRRRGYLLDLAPAGPAASEVGTPREPGSVRHAD